MLPVRVTLYSPVARPASLAAASEAVMVIEAVSPPPLIVYLAVNTSDATELLQPITFSVVVAVMVGFVVVAYNVPVLQVGATTPAPPLVKRTDVLLADASAIFVPVGTAPAPGV